MKKILISVILASAFVLVFSGCGKNIEGETAALSETAAVTEAVEQTGMAGETESVETSLPEETQTETEQTTMPTADENGDFLSVFESFELTSADLSDGVWADEISNTLAGSNVSPELSWEPVEGAEEYVIYMVDPDAYYWIHWKMDGVTATDLERGFGGTSYVGPYPPPGSTHTYDVYVIALRNPVDRQRGTLNAQNQNFPLFINQLDTDIDGNTGNIIAYGRLSGSFTAP